MKKTSSFNLEEDTFNEILEYKEKYNLSSRNVALERMLLERRMLMLTLNNSNATKVDLGNKLKENKQDESNDMLKKSIIDSYNDMPD